MHTPLLCWKSSCTYITLIWVYRLCLHEAPVPLSTAVLRTEFSHAAEHTSKLICAQAVTTQPISAALFNSSSICYSVASAVQTPPARQPSVKQLTVITFYTQCSVIWQCFPYLCVCPKLWSRHRYHGSYLGAQLARRFGLLCSDRLWAPDRGGRWLLLSLRLSLLGILHLPVL